MASKRRLFLAFEVCFPELEGLPQGRVIARKDLHMTLAFLGHLPWEQVSKDMEDLPRPKFSVSPAGMFEKVLFLPQKKPRVVAWSASWQSQQNNILLYQQQLTSWLKGRGYPLEKRKFLPHVTVARAPFSQQEWEESFLPWPVFAKSLHLYETVGNLCYEPVWTHSLQVPFEKEPGLLKIYGESFEDLFSHSFIALVMENIHKLNRNDAAELTQAIACVREQLRPAFEKLKNSKQVKNVGDGVLCWEIKRP